ncbi:hypothetical protein [Franzmannia qiaohouensis]|uniref:Uncharacterized protein n=1 Tax=Franzmannia qiaohouensis TaxID=1329370 RepID=A0ABU1HJ39_9GAMM|nr:hypothetical protein [Halomonas qiaohouensis]MDR5907501.1 hypothetical protein [Halomonas qiaohouensis]
MFNVKHFVRSKLKKYLYGLCVKLFPEIDNNYKTKEIISAALECSNDPVYLINCYHEKLLINDKILWASIREVRVNAPLVFKVVIDQHDLVSSKSLSLRLMATYVIEERVESSDVKVSYLIDKFDDLRNEVNDLSRVKSLIATAIIVKSNLSEIEARLHAINFNIKKLTDHQKVKLLGRYTTHGDQSNFLAIKNSFGNVGAAANIKIDQMHYSLTKDDSQCLNILEKKFEDLPYDISRQYFSYVKPLFGNIESKNNYTDASYSVSKISKLREMILDKIQRRKNLSFIRLGDGEAYGFQNSGYIDSNGYTRQEIHWWGETLPEKKREELQSAFIESLKFCDFLGVPTVTRLIKDFNLEKSDIYEKNTLISRVFCVMTSSPVFFKDKVIVEDQINLHIFNKGFIEDIFEKADKVVFVSGLDKKKISQWSSDEAKLECLEIPTHRLLRDKGLASSVEGILPNAYQEYLQEIKVLAGPGVVFIVSAGFIGKIFIAEAAKHGSVALDIGQTLVSLVADKSVSK